MSDYNLLLDYYHSGDVAGNAYATSGSFTVPVSPPPLPTGRVYACIFNRSHQAIKFNMASPYIFSTYLKSAHNDYIRVLSQHAERTRYFSDTVHCTALNIDGNPYGECYEIELWAELISGTPDRNVDRLLQTKPFTWVSGRVAESRIDISQEENIANLAAAAVFNQDDSILVSAAAGSVGRWFYSELPLSISGNVFGIAASGFTDPNTIGGRINAIYTQEAVNNWVSHVGMSYDSSQTTLRFICWLEKNGEVYRSPQSITIIIIDSTDTEIASITAVDFISSGNFDGYIFKELTGISLDPDQTYAAIISITDDDAVVHTSGAAPITWD